MRGSRVVTPPADVVTPPGRRVVFACVMEALTHRDRVRWWRRLASGGGGGGDGGDELIFDSNPPSSADAGTATVSPDEVAARYEVVGQYSLVVRNATWADSGSYVCELKGRGRHAATLAVVCKCPPNRSRTQ